jgi:ribosomal protein S18 acetylase RimI-like enzyme
MIREATVDDALAIAALRTRKHEGPAVVSTWLVREIGGVISGAVAFWAGEDAFFVNELWVASGFAGFRAAVYLCRHVEALARRAKLPIRFGVMLDNERFQKAVESAGYEPYSINYRYRQGA